MLRQVVLALGGDVLTSALTITAPTTSAGWTTLGPQEITWTSDSSDPTSFALSFTIPLPNTLSPTLLANDVQTSSGSYIWVQPSPPDYLPGGGYAPPSVLAVGSGYYVQAWSHTGAVLSSSNFTVTDGTSTVTAAAGTPTSNSSEIWGGP